MEIINKVAVERKAIRRNAKRSANSIESYELKHSKSDAKDALDSFANAIAELLLAASTVVKFISRDVWAKLGKFIKYVSRKLNKAGNKMDWSDK